MLYDSVDWILIAVVLQANAYRDIRLRIQGGRRVRSSQVSV